MTTDISLFTSESPDSPVRFDLREVTTATGLRRTSQLALLRLSTPLGSAAGQPEFGTNFIRDLLGGKYRTIAAIEKAFSIARLQILRQSENDEDANDDYALGDLQLVGVSLLGDKVDLRINVVSRSGVVAGFGVTA